jgi:adenylate cyclase
MSYPARVAKQPTRRTGLTLRRPRSGGLEGWEPTPRPILRDASLRDAPQDEVIVMATRRRLSAVLHADLSGFVRLMEAGEDRTVGHLKSVRADVWRPAIEAGGGTVVNIEGDSVLAEFGSAVAAVVTAIDIQERMARFNDMLEERERLRFRIGLHLGEVIVDEVGNIFGDGVNVAARIQTLAEPGGIAVSRAVRDIAESKIEHAFVDGGEHEAKNVSRLLRIYHVYARTGASMRTTTSIVPRMTLRFRGTDRTGKKYAFEVEVDRLIALRDGAVIGRDFERCQVVLSHATVSRRHARLVFADGGLQIEDLGSTNGTWVDGAPARPGKLHALQPGITLRLGEIELAVERD